MDTMHDQWNEPDMVTPVRPTWATVIGVIAIVIASLGLVMYGLCTPVSTIGSAIAAAEFDEAAANDPAMAPTAAQLQVTADYAPLTMGNALATAGLGIVLMIGGIGLVRMRPWARSVMLWWAALRIIILIPGTMLSWHVQSKTFEAMDVAAQTSGGPMPDMYSMFTSPLVVGLMVGVSLLFFLAMPVFALIWFNLGSVRTQVLAWRP